MRYSIVVRLNILEQRRSKDRYFRNIKMYKNGKVDSLYGWTLPKIRIVKNFFK